MTDSEFISAFEAATLPRTLWTHEAHVRMAYLYLVGDPDESRVLPEVRERIRRYNFAYGFRTGYHETITVVFLTLVADRLRRDSVHTDTWEAFREAHADLITDGQGALLKHYTRDYLFSAEARASFVAPDVAPLPTP